MSIPCHIDRPPSPGRCQASSSPPPSSAHQREVGDRERDDPHCDAADHGAHDADRPEQAERERRGAEDERPGPSGLEAEQLVGERRRGRRDHEQLEHRPAEALDDVDRRREVRAARAERRPQEHHRRHARLGADPAGDREHQVADHAADEDRDERGRQRERRNEDRPGDDDEQRHAEVAPEEPDVERAEHPQALRHRLDAPRGRTARPRPASVAARPRSGRAVLPSHADEPGCVGPGFGTQHVTDEQRVGSERELVVRVRTRATRARPRGAVRQLAPGSTATPCHIAIGGTPRAKCSASHSWPAARTETAHPPASRRSSCIAAWRDTANPTSGGSSETADERPDREPESLAAGVDGDDGDPRREPPEERRAARRRP